MGYRLTVNMPCTDHCPVNLSWRNHLPGKGKYSFQGLNRLASLLNLELNLSAVRLVTVEDVVISMCHMIVRSALNKINFEENLNHVRLKIGLSL